MSLNILVFIISLGTLSLVVYIFKITESEIKVENKDSIFDEKFKNFSEDINKISKELISVTTPINELNRFLGVT